jgi:hypothetical protein
MDTKQETKKRPVKVNGYSNVKRLVKLNRKRATADQRQAAYDKLTPKQKLERCAARRGESKREVARLTKKK